MALHMLTKPVPHVEVEPVAEPVIEPQKVFVQPTPEIMDADIVAMTAEYIQLWQKFEYFEVKTLVKRMDDLRKALVAVANETVDQNQPAIFSSPAGQVEFTERSKDAIVKDPLALINTLMKKFGPEATASIVDVALTPLRKMLSEFELAKYLVNEPGSRKVRAVRPFK